MTAQMIPQLALLTLALSVSDSFPTDFRGTPKHASWDDVNVVAHGLLQLGQGLKEHVDKTKVQMRDVDARLKAFNATLARLERVQQEERTEEEQVLARVTRLEEKIQTEPDSNHSENSPLVQRMLEAQNRRIEQMVEKIQQQQDRLEKQSVHLQALQSQVQKKRVKSHRRRDEETVLRAAAVLNDHRPGSSRSCHDLFLQGERVSGVYSVQPENSEAFIVLCDMTSEGGWTVVQRRSDGSQSFNRPWAEYRTGFGSLDGEFWLGLEKIHALSAQGQNVLQAELSDQSGRTQKLLYGVHVDGEEQKFSLHLQSESPSGLDTGSSGLPFSTFDQDNDLAEEVNCARHLSGGWWFSDCGASNLNGRFPRRHRSMRQEMFWEKESLKATALKMGPAAMMQR